MALTADIPDSRLAMYRSLQRRNRVVGLLRWLIPGIGVAVLAVLLAQMALASLGRDFTIGRITVARDKLTVEAPSYAGRMADGSVYTVAAAEAQAALDAPSLIDLSEASVILNRSNGVIATATAAAAKLESEKQFVDVAGLTNLTDTTGMRATLYGMHIDFPAQTLTASGAVDITFSGGQRLKSTGMSYDSVASVWKFSDVTLTLPNTPGGEAE
jgi:lipopolysaccharide export system protein LptC